MVGNPCRILQVPGPAALTEPGPCHRGRSVRAGRAQLVCAGSVAVRVAPRRHLAACRGFGRGGTVGLVAPAPRIFGEQRCWRAPGLLCTVMEPAAPGSSRAQLLARTCAGTARSVCGRPALPQGLLEAPEICFPLERSMRQPEGQGAADSPAGRRSASLLQFRDL